LSKFRFPLKQEAHEIARVFPNAAWYTCRVQKETLIFIGASGCGKGTQAKLLVEKLRVRTPNIPIFYLQTGQYFREFIKQDNLAARIAREEIERGLRAPDFLAMHLWSEVFVQNLTGDEHLILDGSPRSLNEAHNLDIALKFFRRENPAVIHLKVSSDWSYQRLKERAAIEGRADDNDESIRRRISWYERDVLPAVNYYRRDRDYEFVEIDGERPIDVVHRDIMAHLFGE
jgi:adenylate kinase